MAAADDTRIERLATYGLTPDDVGDEDLVVEEGEEQSTAELSSITVKPESLAEVREMVGVLPQDSLPLERDHVPPFTPSTEELTESMEADTQPPGSPDEPLSHCVDCLLYRGGNIDLSEEDIEPVVERATLRNWAGRIEDMIEAGVINPSLDLSPWRDIIINDGAKLRVDNNTNVLVADEITIHGSGELTYAGNIKIDCDRTIGRP
jgi:hypothetical protein